MSELKVYNGEDIQDIIDNGDRIDLEYLNKQFVEKSEADKVIAELKSKLDLYKRGFAEDDKINAYLYAELRHQKYKRCLAMAKECVNGEIKLKRVKMRDMNNHQFWQFDNDYWQKWNNRWLELAKKFKETK